MESARTRRTLRRPSSTPLVPRRAWMPGMNPQLDDDSPIEAMAEGRFKEAMAAARSFQRGDL